MTVPAGEIGGILPVLYSFFDQDGGLRMEGFDHQIEHSLAHGANGIVLFGFVTQFYRLTFPEKQQIAKRAAATLKGRGSLGITVMEPSEEAQIALVRVAEDVGADWVILQPPLGPPSDPALWVDMVARIAATTDLPVAVQNAPIAGTTLSIDALLALQDRRPNVRLCKAETQAEEVAAFARDHGGQFRVLTGNWGVEYPFFRANGAHGLIPAPNFVPEQTALHEATGPGGDPARADRIHASILPLMQFLRERPAPEMQLLYGKYVYQRRTGFSMGGNRRPGPSLLDPALVRHADRLCERLWR